MEFAGRLVEPNPSVHIPILVSFFRNKCRLCLRANFESQAAIDAFWFILSGEGRRSVPKRRFLLRFFLFPSLLPLIKGAVVNPINGNPNTGSSP